METMARKYFVDYYKRCLEKSPCEKMSKMAVAAGMAPSTINRFLKDPFNPKTSLPRTDTLLKISEYSGVPIFSGLEEMGWLLAKKPQDHKINNNNEVPALDPTGKSQTQIT